MIGRSNALMRSLFCRSTVERPVAALDSERRGIGHRGTQTEPSEVYLRTSLLLSAADWQQPTQSCATEVATVG